MNATTRTWIHPNARRPRFLITAFLIGAALFAGMGLLASRYQVGISDEEVQSLKHSWFLIDTKDHAVTAGEYVVFRLDRDLPPWPAGSQFVKKVVAVSGDRIAVSEGATKVNGVEVAGSLDLLSLLNKPASAFVREEVVPSDAMFVVGENARSYDSRYWGNVRDFQIIGRGYPLW